MNNRLFKKIYPGSSTDTIIKILNENFDNLERELDNIKSEIKNKENITPTDEFIIGNFYDGDITDAKATHECIVKFMETITGKDLSEFKKDIPEGSRTHQFLVD